MQKHKSTAICWACVFCLSEEKLVLGFGNTLCMWRGAADPIKCFSLQEQTRVKHAFIWHHFNNQFLQSVHMAVLWLKTESLPNSANQFYKTDAVKVQNMTNMKMKIWVITYRKSFPLIHSSHVYFAVKYSKYSIKFQQWFHSNRFHNNSCISIHLFLCAFWIIA